MVASFCRKEPAAALRGLMKVRPSAARCRSLSSSNDEIGMYTSPRTSTTFGAALQHVGHDPDRAHVGGDVLTGHPVTPGGRPGQPAVLVQEGHGQPVDL